MHELEPHPSAPASHAAADQLEVSNYIKALRHGCQALDKLPLCLRIVKEMHFLLMQGVRGQNKLPGEIRREQNQIGSDARYVPPPPDEAKRLMHNLEKQMNVESDPYDLVRIYIIHYQFEAIHPFLDGNGRVGRALIALMIYKLFNHANPLLYMSAYFERFKDEYIENMFRISTQGKWTKWIEYCLRGTILQANDAIRRCQQLNVLKGQFHKRVGFKAGPRALQIIEELFISPVLTIPSLAARFKVTYPTAKSDIDRLIKVQILVEIEGHSPKVFAAPEVMKIAYLD